MKTISVVLTKPVILFFIIVFVASGYFTLLPAQWEFNDGSKQGWGGIETGDGATHFFFCWDDYISYPTGAYDELGNNLGSISFQTNEIIIEAEGSVTMTMLSPDIQNRPEWKDAIGWTGYILYLGDFGQRMSLGIEAVFSNDGTTINRLWNNNNDVSHSSNGEWRQITVYFNDDQPHHFGLRWLHSNEDLDNYYGGVFLDNVRPLYNEPDLFYTSAGYTYKEPNLEIKFTAGNKGAAKADASVIKFLLSPNSDMSEAEVIGERNLFELSPNMLTLISFNTDLSGYSGTYYVGFKLDYDDVLTESNEDNNLAVLSPPLNFDGPNDQKPDMTVTQVSVTNQTGPLIEYQFTIKNQGDAGTFINGINCIYLSSDQEIRNSDYKINEIPFSHLAPGETWQSLPIQTGIYGVPAGEYYLGVITDSDNDIAESNEYNNEEYDQVYKVTIAEELQVSDIDLSPDMVIFDQVVLGNSGLFSITVSNTGNGDLQIYDTTIEGPDSDMFGIQNSVTGETISPGNSVELSLIFTPTTTGFLGSILKIFSNDPDENPISISLFGECIIPGNMIINGDFSNDMNNWEFVTMGAGNAVCSIAENIFCTHITNGGQNVWEVSLQQYDLLIENGKTYTVNFIACADNPRDIQAWVAMRYEPYTIYNDEFIFSLTQDWQTYTFTFNMDYPTNNQARIGFDMGTSGIDVQLDNISLVVDETVEPEEPTGNMLTNWNFNNNVDGWFLFTQDGAKATGSHQNGEFKVAIETAGAQEWHVQFGQLGLLSEYGGEYKVSFDAWASAPRTIVSNVMKWAEPWNAFSNFETFSLTTTKQTFTYSFVMNDPTCSFAALDFNLGGSSVNVYFDNMSLVKTSMTGISEDQQKHCKKFQLLQNYPNPFNPVTILEYEIPQSGSVELGIYNITGQLVETLVSGKQQAGRYHLQWDGSTHSNGVYFYKLRAQNYIEIRKMILLK